MSKRKSNFKEIISPIDVIPVIVILIGLLIAFFFEDSAVRLIGVSVAVLGAVSLFMLISQRNSDVVRNPFPKSSEGQDFEVTTTKDYSGTRRTVENFEESFGKDDEFPMNEKAYMKFESEAEKSKHEPTKATSKQYAAESRSSGFSYNESTSGMRIVGITKRTHSAVSIAPEELAKNTELEEKILIKDNINAENTYTNVAEDIEEYDLKEQEQQSENKPEPVSQSVLTTDEFNELEEIYDVQEMEPIIEELAGPVETHQKVIEEETEIPISQPKRFTEKKIDMPISVFTEIDQILGDEPRKEFEYFLSRILIIIRSITDSRTALFLLADYDNNEFIVEAFATNKPELLSGKKRIPISTDILSQILGNAKPEILTDINPSAELDLIPYYNQYSQTLSFVGVPVFWGEHPVGVLCADSTSNDAYSSSTVAFLGHFTKLISALIKSYTQKYDLLQASKTLEAVNLFNYIATSSKDGTENLAETIVDSVSRIFDYQTTGVIGFNSEKQIWELKAVKSAFNYNVGQEITFEDSIVGNTITSCKTFRNTAKEIRGVRHTKFEPKLESGEFISIPLRSATGVYGAMFVENVSANHLSDFDITILEILGIHAGNAIERMHLMESLNRSQLLNHETGLLNPTAFYKRIEEEMDRSRDMHNDLTLCIFKIDKYAALDPEKHWDRFEFAQMMVIEKVKKYLKQYEKFGHIDESTYGVIFVAKESNQVKLIAERARAEIANTVLNVDGSKFSVTLSIGIAGLSNSDHDISSFINNAGSALNKALERTNNVHLFY
jgi:GGDEF domain-containing protein/putative methionine-R-sulfoxide reductase with GAF domain